MSLLFLKQKVVLIFITIISKFDFYSPWSINFTSG
jgi:hypothetical protein